MAAVGQHGSSPLDRTFTRRLICLCADKVMDEEKFRLAESLLRDTENRPFAGDVIKQLRIGETALYRYFPPERIREPGLANA